MIDEVIQDEGDLLSEDILVDETPLENEILFYDEPELLIEESEEIELSDELILEETEVINNELPQVHNAEISSESNENAEASIDVSQIVNLMEEQKDILETVNENLCVFEENMRLFQTVTCCFLSFIIGCLLVYFVLGRLS